MPTTSPAQRAARTGNQPPYAAVEGNVQRAGMHRGCALRHARFVRDLEQHLALPPAVIVGVLLCQRIRYGDSATEQKNKQAHGGCGSRRRRFWRKVESPCFLRAGPRLAAPVAAWSVPQAQMLNARRTLSATRSAYAMCRRM